MRESDDSLRLRVRDKPAPRREAPCASTSASVTSVLTMRAASGAIEPDCDERRQRCQGTPGANSVDRPDARLEAAALGDALRAGQVARRSRRDSRERRRRRTQPRSEATNGDAEDYLRMSVAERGEARHDAGRILSQKPDTAAQRVASVSSAA